MSTCIDCGKPITRGRTGCTNDDLTICLVCSVARDLATFKYQSRAARLYALGKQQEAACTTHSTSES